MAIIRVDNNGTGWDDFYEVGDSVADTVDYVVGTQSINVTTQTLNTFAGIYNEVSFNLTGRNIRLYVKSPNWSLVSQCVLILGSDSWSFGDTVTLDIGTRLVNPPNNEWIEIVVPRSAFEVYGTPDWSAINMALFRVKDTNSSFATVKLDSISSFTEGQEGVVSITFDDGYDDVYDTAKPILDNKDFVATAFIIPSLLGDSGYLTQTEVDSLHSGGWDISGHSDKNLTTLTSGELTTEISSLTTYFSSKNYRGRNLFAFPYGAWNQDVIDEIEGFFTRGFNIDGWNNPLNNLSSFRINRQSVDKWTTTTMIEGWIDAAKDNGEWCILNFHTLVSTLVDSQDFLTSDFTTIINYLDSEGITVLPISEALSFLYNSSGRNLYLLGYDTGNSERGLYLSAFDYGNAERSLYLTGSTTDSSERSLYLIGSIDDSAEREIYLSGKENVVEDINLYLTGIGYGGEERNIYLSGIDNSTADRSIYLVGMDYGNGERNLYLQGSILDNAERGLYLQGVDTSTSERGLYLEGKDSSTSDMGLYLVGIDSDSAEMGIYLEGSLPKWTSKVGAWIYPGEPACNADEEYSDGRTFHFLNVQYYTLNASGVLELLTEADDGCNGYSEANVADIKTYSTEQYITVSANYTNMATLLGNATLQSNFISTAVTFLTDNDLTGIDIDFEGYDQWTSTDYTNYKAFITALGNALHTAGRKLNIEVPAIWDSTSQGWYELKYEDFESIPIDKITIMAYDYQYTRGGRYPIAPLWWIKAICEWALAKMTTDSKICMGLNSYGYHTTTDITTISINTKTQAEGYTGYSGATRNRQYLLDDFNDNTFNTKDWNRTSDVRIVEQNNRLELSTTTTAGYHSATALGQIDLVDGAIYIEVPEIGNTALESYEAYPFQLILDDDNKYSVYVAGSTIYFAKRVGASNTTIATETYSATNHRWLKIEDDGTNIVFSRSSDGETWIDCASSSNSDMDVSGLTLIITVGNWGAEASGTFMAVDNLTLKDRNISNDMHWQYDGNDYWYADTYSMISKRLLIEETGIEQVAVWHLGGNDWFEGYELIPESEEVGLYLQGKDTSNSEFGLYLQGVASSSSERDLFTQGTDEGDSERGLHIEGSISADSERSLYLSGIATANSTRNLYLAGIDTGTSERGLYTQGTLDSDSERGLWMSGQKPSWVDKSVDYGKIYVRRTVSSGKSYTEKTVASGKSWTDKTYS